MLKREEVWLEGGQGAGPFVQTLFVVMSPLPRTVNPVGLGEGTGVDTKGGSAVCPVRSSLPSFLSSARLLPDLVCGWFARQ